MPLSSGNIEVIGVYRYEKASTEDLAFEKDEHLTILRKLTDGNWALARNRKGDSGLIPLNFVEISSDPSWLHGPISREETELLLQDRPLGSFLVRESGRFPGDYTLSTVSSENGGSDTMAATLTGGTTIQHYHIHTVTNLDASVPSKLFSLDKDELFPSLRKLVEHYKFDDRGLVSPLTIPLPDMLRRNLQQLHQHNWIPRERLVLGQKLGHGEFGEVFKATFMDREVAVKRYKASAKRHLVYEACVMAELNHRNLVPLLGVTEDEKGTFYLLTEFFSNGSLLCFLRSRGRAVIVPFALLSFATDVACGLVYMEEHSYVHCDIAARNVLLSSVAAPSPSSPIAVPTAKLSDFGLAYRLRSPQANGNSVALSTDTHLMTFDEEVEYFQSTVSVEASGKPLELARIARIPIKWTAVESIKTRIFSHKSDVWSFGIMLWELYSYGRLPYPRLLTNQVLKHLESGERMECPEGCPPEIYNLMRETWTTAPQTRPSFAEILHRLESLQLLTPAHPVAKNDPWASPAPRNSASDYHSINDDTYDSISEDIAIV